MKRIRAALILLATSTVSARAQTITGTVMDSAANTRIAAAQVMLIQVDSSASVITDSMGKFRFNAVRGMFALHVRALGYQDVKSQVMQIGLDENVSVLIFPNVSAVAVAPVLVLARRRAPLTNLELFEKRRKSGGFGYFIDQKMISQLPSFQVSDLLRRVPGIQIGSNRVSLRPHCYDAIYIVDGTPIHGTTRGLVTEADTVTAELLTIPDVTATEQVNTLISASEVAAIEVYKGEAGLPVELAYALSGALKGTQTCGLVAIWTKR